MPYLDPATLQPYLDARLLTMQRHPEYPELCIYNYTNRCTYEKAWDAVTTQCRGLVLDTQQETVAAACFPKFWNWQEHVQRGDSLPWETPLIYEKYDGWYGALIWIKNEAWISTRGSFTSPGAQWATTWFRSCIPFMQQQEYDFWRNENVTHLFEIIAPETRIVIKYDFVNLMWLGTLNRQSGHTAINPTTEHHFATICVADRIAHDDYRTLTEQPYADSEGFVVLFPQADLRIKLKFAEYVERHRLYTGLSVHALWKMLYDGMGIDEIITGAPDELQPWVSEKIGDMAEGVMAQDWETRQVHERIMMQLDQSWGDNKVARDKAIALAFKSTENPFLFQYHKYREALWKSIEPAGSETFRQES